MPRNQWLAIDEATPPGLHARAMRREWEEFVSRGRVGRVRAPVADSWRRSLDAGVDPSGSRLAPVSADRDEALARWDVHPLREAAPLIRDCLASIADESEWPDPGCRSARYESLVGLVRQCRANSAGVSIPRAEWGRKVLYSVRQSATRT
jgi:hypothetical protein